MPVSERDSKAIVLTTDKTLDDMDGPGQALSLAVTRSAGNCSRRGVPAAIVAAASNRQLQLTGAITSGSSSSNVARKVPLIRLSLCQTLTRPITGADSGSPTAGAPAEADAVDQAGYSKSAAAATAGAGASKATTAEAAASTSKGAGPDSSAAASDRGIAPAGGVSAGSGGGSGSSKSAVSKAAIMSFRKVELLVGAMDLKTDQVGATVHVW